MSGILVPKSSSTSIASQAKTCAVHNGYHEVVQFSFVSQQMLDLFPNNATPIEIHNPIHSEFGFMRTNVLQSLVMAAQYNFQRQINDLKLFEVGESFQLIDGKVQEQTELAAICIGNANKGLHNSNTSVDYYDMQRVAINVLAHLGISQVSIAKSHHPALHPKQSSCIIHLNNVVGEIGMLHPTTQNTLGLPSAGVILIYLDKLIVQDSKIISPPSKYPSITRDITLTVLDTLQVDEIDSAINQAEVAYLAKYIVSDIYQQEGDSSSKSITWSFTFKSDEKTLTDKEINSSVSQIRKAMRPFEIGSTDQ
ncbi:MAG: hypothetical protein VXW87_03330 [Pseudomonadota bacterium]|nr:hypothetical protein [Pseudomonadota bacterium]